MNEKLAQEKAALEGEQKAAKGILVDTIYRVEKSEKREQKITECERQYNALKTECEKLKGMVLSSHACRHV